jgi:hypothetical protein
MKENKIIDNIFNKLNKIQVGEFVTLKNVGEATLKYLSWTDAFTLLFKEYEEKDIQYKIFYNDKINDLPIFGCENIGYYVKTEVTICEITKQMILPVLDGANKAKKLNQYSYFVKNYKTQNLIEKKVSSIDMMDINTTVQRCLVKNIAMFGLGLSVYRGDDLSNFDNDDDNKNETSVIDVKNTTDYKKIIEDDKIKKQFGELVKDHKALFTEDELAIYANYWTNNEIDKMKNAIVQIQTRIMKG